MRNMSNFYGELFMNKFVKDVMKKADIDTEYVFVNDDDLDRAYLTVDGNENDYYIKADLLDNNIYYTLYKDNKKVGSGAYYGYYNWNNLVYEANN